jgi:hypothetical protein
LAWGGWLFLLPLLLLLLLLLLPDRVCNSWRLLLRDRVWGTWLLMLMLLLLLLLLLGCCLMSMG